MKVKNMTEDLMNFEDFIKDELTKDPEMAKEILSDEIAEYRTTGDITYILKNLGRMVAIKGLPFFEEKTKISRSIIYGIIHKKMPLDISVINKMLTSIGLETI